MVSSIGASYNVLSLFRSSTSPQSSASSEAVESIIEKARQMRADVKPSYMQGVSLGTAAWMSQADSAGNYIYVKDLDLTKLRTQFGSDDEFSRFTQRLAENTTGYWPTYKDFNEAVTVFRADYKVMQEYQQKESAYTSRVEATGSETLKKMLEIRSSEPLTMASAIRSYNAQHLIAQDGYKFVEEQQKRLETATQPEEIAKIKDGIMLANDYIERYEKVSEIFDTYLAYFDMEWNSRAYEVVGELYHKNDDGTYAIGAFQIQTKDENLVYWSSDGSGIAKMYYAMGGYDEVDLAFSYMPPNPIDTMAKRIDHLQSLPYRAVTADGQMAFSARPLPF